MPRLSIAATLLACFLALFPNLARCGELDEILTRENAERGETLAPLEAVDDLGYLRRASLDLIGRIPTQDEITEYQSWPSDTRRQQLVDKLLADPRFVDTWTVFYADLFRLKGYASGGAAGLTKRMNALTDQMLN